VAISFHCECGKEFLASDEESGRRMKCPGCQREVIVPPPKPPAEGDFSSFREPSSTRTSGKAIASLVLGLCSPFTCPLTSIPAIVLGIRGLNDIKNPKNRLTGRPLAIYGWVQLIESSINPLEIKALVTRDRKEPVTLPR
jgi:DNA-directed RNA polymerase subunit RPC12/RpoP